MLNPLLTTSGTQNFPVGNILVCSIVSSKIVQKRKGRGGQADKGKGGRKQRRKEGRREGRKTDLCVHKELMNKIQSLPNLSIKVMISLFVHARLSGSDYSSASKNVPPIEVF